MKARRKTYGIYGYIEYQAVINVGQNKIKIPFTGGTVSAFGTTPATFETDNLVAQISIEHSPEYRSGKISLLRDVELDRDIEIGNNGKPAAKGGRLDGTPAPAGLGNGIAENGIGTERDQEADGDGGDATASGEDASAVASGEIAPAVASGDVAPAITEEVEFSCVDDAKEYLTEKFGAQKSKLRTRAAIIECGKQYGVDIVFED